MAFPTAVNNQITDSVAPSTGSTKKKKPAAAMKAKKSIKAKKKARKK